MNRLLTGIVTFLVTAIAVAAPTEYEVKAAFLYNFAKFTEWPSASSDSSLELCLFGNGPYRKALQSLEGKHVRDQVLSVRVLDTADIPDSCRILYVTAEKTDMLDAIYKSISGHQGLLSVSDIEGFTQSGGIIEFRLIDNKLRFAINLQAARASEIDLSSKLLRLAVAVKE